MEILLCITADDLGYSTERDLGIIESSISKGGLVCRASLLVNGATALSGYKLARENDLPVGLHLNISEGSPCSPLSQVSSLVNEFGYFHGKGKIWGDDFEKLLIDLDEVKIETEAQISRFLEISNGYLPNHWDGHQHVHVKGEIGEAIMSVFSKHMLFRTRLPYYFSSTVKNDVTNSLLLPLTTDGMVDKTREIFYKRISNETLSLKRSLDSCDLDSCFNLFDASKMFMGYSTMGKDCTEERIYSALRECIRLLKMKPIVVNSNEKGVGASLDLIDIEWMTHPGYKTLHFEQEDDEKYLSSGCGQGADDFSKSEEREIELNHLRQGPLSEKIKAFFRSNNIVLCA